MPDGVVQYVSKRLLYRQPRDGETKASVSPPSSPPRPSLATGNNA